MINFLPLSRAGLVLLAAGALPLAPAPFPSPAVAQNAPADFTGIVRQKMPAVVAITTRQMIEERSEATSDDAPGFFRRFGEGAAPRVQARMALGSGFVIRPDGYIVTNNHVVENADEIHVVFNDRTNVSARLVGRDPATDLAVLKVERTNLPAVSWGNSDAMEPGAWTIAIGSPFGLGGTVTAGVLSARSRDIHSGPYDDFLQTDAAINQGNSGGPLFNAQGEVIGVNTAIFSPSGGSVGIGFAIPSRTAQAVADQLIRTGRVERGFLGVRLQEITPAIAQSLGLPSRNGALVASVEPGSPADRAGVKTGDVITRYGDRSVEGPRDLTRAVVAERPGDQVPLAVLRNGATEQLTVTVGQRKEERTAAAAPSQNPEAGGRRLGMLLGRLDERARRQLGPDANGVVVERVDPNGPAADNGIRPGDVIVSANNRPVNAPSDVADEWTKSRSNNKPILLRVRRGDQYMFIAIGA